MSRIFITGDKHGDYAALASQLKTAETNKNDVVVVLGDHGTLYYGEDKDNYKKKIVSRLPASFIMIRGNHDRRPTSDVYKHYRIYVDTPTHQGIFYVDPNFPNILYTTEYGLYRFGTKECFVIGGAYSVDKFRRLGMQELGFSTYHWFHDEQLSEDEREAAEHQLTELKNSNIDILSHTCPFDDRPVDQFLPSIDQSMVDNTMEQWMNKIKTIQHRNWYCGHWHVDRTTENVRFLYNDLILYDEVEE